MKHSYVKVTGLGFQLPDTCEYGVCDSKERFWEIIKNGESVISNTPEYEKYDIKLSGKIHEWKLDELNIAEKHIGKYSTATLMGSLALKYAMQDAGYSSDDLSNDRTLLIVSSTMLTLENLDKQLNRMYEHGIAAVGFDFFIQGTPGSIGCGISKVLALDCPVLTFTGSCAITPTAIQVAYEKLQLDIADKVIVIGVDDANDPLYFSSVTHRMKNGQTIASLEKDKSCIRPHDKRASGNACGQGAIAIILEKETSTHECAYNTSPFVLYYSNSRKNGKSMFDCGEPTNFALSIKKVLEEANIKFDEVGFINDFSEGAGFIEDFFVDVIERTRRLLNYEGEILVTNQEASFGHIGGVAGLIKLLSNLMMMNKGIVAPCVNCEEVPIELNALPVTNMYINKPSNYSMMMSCGAGGDCSISLLKINLNFRRNSD